jgi:hypothetical protein
MSEIAGRVGPGSAKQRFTLHRARDTREQVLPIQNDGQRQKSAACFARRVKRAAQKDLSFRNREVMI